MTNRGLNQTLINAKDSKAKYEKIRLPLDEGLEKSQKSFNLFAKPFRGMWVSGVSSNSVEVDVLFNSQFDTGSSIALKKNLTINHDELVLDALFTAKPQPNEWIEIIFSFESKINVGNIEQIVTGEVDLANETTRALTGANVSMGPYNFTRKYMVDNDLYYAEGEVFLNSNNTAGVPFPNLQPTGFNDGAVVDSSGGGNGGPSLDELSHKCGELELNANKAFVLTPVCISMEMLQGTAPLQSMKFYHESKFNGPSVTNLINASQNLGIHYAPNVTIPTMGDRVIYFDDKFQRLALTPQPDFQWVIGSTGAHGMTNTRVLVRAIFKLDIVDV